MANTGGVIAQQVYSIGTPTNDEQMTRALQITNDPDSFKRLTIDLYIPAGDSGYWEGAVRDIADPVYDPLAKCILNHEPFSIDLLYGDQEGGQRTITRFTLLPGSEDAWYAQAGRHWNLDRPDPR